MKILTLIPDADSYGIMVLACLSLGSFAIARHIHIRFSKSLFSFVGSNALVKTVIALMGLLIIPFDNLFSQDIFHEIISVVIGIVTGFMSILIEIKMIRKMNRANLVSKTQKKFNTDNNILRNANINKKMSLSSKKNISANGFTHIRQGYNQYAAEPDFLNYSLVSVIIVAISEEFLFRGYMISIAESMPGKIMMILIIITSLLLFAFSHLATRWDEFKCKLPLSVFTTAGFLLTGTLSGAIATHITFNIYAFTLLKKNAR